MQVVLVMFRADGERRSFSIVRDMTVVGRREDCDLRIPLGEVSRKHCRLIKDGDTVRLEDLGSSNGTHHNGQRIQEAILSPGDTVSVGPVSFVVQIDGVPADDELQPSAQPVEGAAAEADQLEEFVPVEDDENADPNAPSEHTVDAHEAPAPAAADDDFAFQLDDAEPAPVDELVNFEVEATQHDHPA